MTKHEDTIPAAGGSPLDRPVGRLEPERSTRHLLTPEMLEAEDAAGGVFAAGALARCEHCDDTGDVHGFDGDWRGYCVCNAGKALKARGQPPCQQCGAMTDEEAATKCLGAAAGDDCHGNHLWPT